MSDQAPRPIKFDSDLFKYLLIDMLGICVALYLLLSVRSPDVLADLGAPVLIEGNVNYVMACLAILAGAMPLLRYVQRKAAEARGDAPPSNNDVM